MYTYGGRYFKGYILHIIIYLHLRIIHESEKKTVGLRINRRPFKLDPK